MLHNASRLDADGGKTRSLGARVTTAGVVWVEGPGNFMPNREDTRAASVDRPIGSRSGLETELLLLTSVIKEKVGTQVDGFDSGARCMCGSLGVDLLYFGLGAHGHACDLAADVVFLVYLLHRSLHLLHDKKSTRRKKKEKRRRVGDRRQVLCYVPTWCMYTNKTQHVRVITLKTGAVGRVWRWRCAFLTVGIGLLWRWNDDKKQPTKLLYGS